MIFDLKSLLKKADQCSKFLSTSNKLSTVENTRRVKVFCGVCLS